jgi:acid stress-induced BolA-like protein IbaG/YrbA
MDLKEKIVTALSQVLEIDYVRLEDDDGISGFVVSPRFEGTSSLDRQLLIDQALQSFTPEERRQVLMIAGLTPVEYDAVGTRIRVHKIREMGGGKVEVLLDGGRSDAEYVREALSTQKGVRTTAPHKVNGSGSGLISFRAEGTEATPLTKEKALRVLRKDRYIEVMPNA